MDKLWKCLIHGIATEIFCKACKTYICAECITEHGKKGHKPDYIHIMAYAPDVAVPLVDNLLKEVGGKDSEMNLDATEFVETLKPIVVSVKDPLIAYAAEIVRLRGLTGQLNTYISPLKQESFVERIKNGLSSDKKRLQEAIKNKELTTVISIMRKIEAEGKMSGGSEKDKSLVGSIKKELDAISDLKTYKDIVDALQMLTFKCQHLKLGCSITDWKCDKKYLTTKMTLSEDGLVYGNQAGAGYPGIIGDTPFETGISAFEVMPEALCCGGNEGFGIIELEKYQRIFTADSVTPTCNNEMIGLFMGNQCKGMTVIAGSTITMGQKYIVKVDLCNFVITIKGPGCNLRGDLKPETSYVPCFSCGCRANKFTIRPLDYYEDE